MIPRLTFAPGEIDAIGVDFSALLATKDRDLGLAAGTVEIATSAVTATRGVVSIGVVSEAGGTVSAWINAAGSLAVADAEDLVRFVVTTTHGHTLVQSVRIAICAC